jgi:hypothetical protein
METNVIGISAGVTGKGLYVVLTKAIHQTVLSSWGDQVRTQNYGSKAVTY